jgi:flagellar basal body-associated protein FliL
MAKDNSGDEQASLINEILIEADPEFVKELDSINPEILNGIEIPQIGEKEVEEAKLWYKGFWFSWETKIKVIFVFASFAAISLPIITMAYLGWLTPSYAEDDYLSLEELSDEAFLIKSGEKQSNVYTLFPVLVYTIELKERVYPLNNSGRKKFGRFSFYVEFFSREDLEKYEDRKAQIIDAIANTIRKTSEEDWQGVSGKEKIREQLLASLNNSLEVRAKSIRFKNIFI